MRARTLARLLALPALALTLVAGPAVTPASAVTEHEFLTGYGQVGPLPAPVTPPENCVYRSLHLDAGTYSWTLNSPGGSAPADDIKVQDGTYDWRLCVYPLSLVYLIYTKITAPGQIDGFKKETTFSTSFLHTATWGSTLYRWGPL
ncbi:hypothetical protein ACFVVL_00705 [Kitasatospora sp. NPDC058115]|uniref:hypothetical protein n=1 Tax=Kitasatospora sp. NPDC058115 TaxID=3346347 RepID=UPI0036D89746